MTQHEPVDVLVVEDQHGQRASVVLGLQNSIPDVRVTAVRDGAEALDFLFSHGAWTDRLGKEPPRLILVDLGLPGMDGFTVLGQIRSFDAQEALTLTPVVAFTDSGATGDISESYRCGVNRYIIKPLSYPDSRAIVETVGEYWINHNKVPV